MRTEILHINQLHCPYMETRDLENVTLHVMEDECAGFIGLSDSGKDYLIKLLCGDDPDADLRDMRLYISGKRILSNTELRTAVYHIHSSNYAFQNWTVAEYIGLVNGSWFLSDKRKKQMVVEAQAILAYAEMDIAADSLISQLSGMQLRLLDMAKAAAGGYRILVIEDDFEIISKREMDEFKHILQSILNRFHMAAIINLHAAKYMLQFPDKYIFFRDGRITKKCRREAIATPEQFDLYMLGRTRTSIKREMDAFTFHERMSHPDGGQDVYTVYNYQTLQGQLLNLSFRSGEVTSFVVFDDNEKQHLFDVLSGRERDLRTIWKINDKRMYNADVGEFVRKRIASVHELGSYEDAFSHMSAGENLVMPSLQKISFTDYLVHGEQIMKYGVQIPGNMQVDLSAPVTDLPLNDYIAMTMERWCLFRPYAIIFMEPFARCDIYGISVVKSYIRRLCKQGSSVIIIKNKTEHIEDLSDKTIFFN